MGDGLVEPRRSLVGVWSGCVQDIGEASTEAGGVADPSSNPLDTADVLLFKTSDSVNGSYADVKAYPSFMDDARVSRADGRRLLHRPSCVCSVQCVLLFLWTIEYNNLASVVVYKKVS